MERDLVLEASGGDRDAFGDLMAGSIDRCYALAFRILCDGELARDAVQGALLGAWEDLPSLRDPDRFDAWLTRLVVNACYAEARRERRWTAKLHLIPFDHPTLPALLTLSARLRTALGAAISGETITFTLGGFLLSTQIDGAGRATVQLPAPPTDGRHVIGIAFAGDQQYGAASTSMTLRVH